MVDVGAKPPSRRRAVARGRVRMAPVDGRAAPRRCRRATRSRSPGSPAIQAAKRTSDLIPLCHPLPLTVVEVDLDGRRRGRRDRGGRRDDGADRRRDGGAHRRRRRRAHRLRHGEGGRQGDADRRDRARLEDEGARVSVRRGAAARSGSRGSSGSSTPSSRCRSRTSAPCSRSTAGRASSAMAWITVAMVGARTLAMGLNRLVDAEIDARNPRTADAELPAGALTRAQVAALCAARARRSTSSRSSSSTRSCAGSGRSPS